MAIKQHLFGAFSRPRARASLISISIVLFRNFFRSLIAHLTQIFISLSFAAEFSLKAAIIHRHKEMRMLFTIVEDEGIVIFFAWEKFGGKLV